MDKEDALRFKVSISKKAYPELHQYIQEAGPYYGSKRMLQLALLGMSVTKGHQVVTTPPVTWAPQPTPQTVSIIESSSTGDNSYHIPENATAAIGDMFDSLEYFGMGTT